MRSRLLDRTRELLLTRPANVSLNDVAKGAGLSPAWVGDFSWQRTRDPSVTKVETLYCYLSGKSLDV